MATEGADGTKGTPRVQRSTRRLLLVDGFDDPFITRVARDIASAAQDLDIETVVLGEERGETHPFLRVSRYDVGRKVPGGPAHPSPRPEDIDLEVAFRRAAGMHGRSRAQAGLALSEWRREAEFVLESVSPDVVIVWNGLLHVRRVYAQAARERPILSLFAERGLLAETFYLDPDGIGPLSRLWKSEPAPTESEVSAFDARFAEQVARGQTGWPQPPRVGEEALRRRFAIPPRATIVLFAGQVESDANLLLFSPHFRSGDDAIRWCAAGLSPRQFLVLKPHPKSLRDPREYRRLLRDRGVVATDVHILDAVAVADVVVTVNSTVALEAALLGKPVLVLGLMPPTRNSFVAAWEPPTPAHLAIDRCLAHHADRAVSLRKAAVAFAAHADAACGHLGDVDGTRRLLETALPPVEAPAFPRANLRELERILVDRSFLPRYGRALRRGTFRIRAVTCHLFRRAGPRIRLRVGDY